MTSNKTTSAQLFVKVPQYVEETTEGTTPTASPTFTACGPSSSLSVKIDGGFVEVGQLGAEDLIALVQGLQKYEVQIKTTLTNSTFLKYGFNAANYATPTGTVSATLSILFSFYLNGTENFCIVKGARCKQVQVDMEIGKPTEATFDFEAVSIIAPITTANAGLTTPTFASTPSGTVWDHLSGGASPVSWNSTGLDCKKFSITVNRNTTPDYTLGTATPFSTQPHGRKIAGDFTNLYTVTTLDADFRAGTARTLACVLKTATSTITCTSAYIVNYTRDSDESSNDARIESCNFKCLSATVT